MKITDIYNDILSRKFRSAWGRGVAQYALELLHGLANNGEEEYTGSPYDHPPFSTVHPAGRNTERAAALSATTAPSPNASAIRPGCAAPTSSSATPTAAERSEAHRC